MTFIMIKTYLVHSIEDAKQKAEHDKMMREAEARKQEVRRIITQLRRQFKKLLERNHELPPHLRLDTMVWNKKIRVICSLKEG